MERPTQDSANSSTRPQHGLQNTLVYISSYQCRRRQKLTLIVFALHQRFTRRDKRDEHGPLYYIRLSVIHQGQLITLNETVS